MNSLYIHVPFCRSKCHYCDFYSLVRATCPNGYAKLIVDEMVQRKAFLPSLELQSVYIGGGSPSALAGEQVEEMIDGVKANFNLHTNAEITVEVNPDDIDPALLEIYHRAGINRVSMGVQSFIDSELQLLGRRHSAQRAAEAVELLKTAGFSNISIDLIYGIPGSTAITWQHSLQKAVAMDVQHLSCYHLTIEEHTVLGKMEQRGKLQPIDEELSVAQYELMRQILGEYGYLHYEISNFAQKGYIAQHNSGYWLGANYLGLGPAAHSYNGATRQWNPPSLAQWQLGIEAGQPHVEEEAINPTTRFNELLLTRLRTVWGVSLREIEERFPQYHADLMRHAETYLKSGYLEITPNGALRIPPQRFFVSDNVVAHLFVE